MENVIRYGRYDKGKNSGLNGNKKLLFYPIDNEL